MSKYEPLRAFLEKRSTLEVPMSFGEIERVIAASLPPVARKHRAWWSNNPSNSVMTRAWLDAGFKSERVDLASERLVFRRTAPSKAARPAETGGLLVRLRARLGAALTIAPGVDLTQPTGDRWDAEG